MLAFLALAAALPAAAEAPLQLSPDVQMLERGLICNPPSAGRRTAPDTVAGWIHVPDEPVRIIRQGSVAPALLGTGFGVEFTLTGEGVIDLRYSVSHPPMAPDGQTTQAWNGRAVAGMREAIFFQFDTEEELLPGRWVFTASTGEDEVFRAAFDVVDPATVPHLTGLCLGGGFLSLLHR
ncbi:MAG: DUF3859 domain-containing protein [Pararhodobacter sp.]